jgi:hypothetical protein
MHSATHTAPVPLHRLWQSLEQSMSGNGLAIKRAAPCGVGGVLGEAVYPMLRVGLWFLPSGMHIYREGGGQEGAHEETGCDAFEG